MSNATSGVHVLKFKFEAVKCAILVKDTADKDYLFSDCLFRKLRLLEVAVLAGTAPTQCVSMPL